jgi:hypothetical protein
LVEFFDEGAETGELFLGNPDVVDEGVSGGSEVDCFL